MQGNIERFLEPVFRRADVQKQESDKIRMAGLNGNKTVSPIHLDAALETKQAIEIPLEFNGKDYVSFLLYVDAEIEHGLMLQYLYAAYSLGGSQIDEKYREKIRAWQEVILGIAKEEMGHLISVQNVLKLIGAPLNFGRQDYPWDSDFYPFPFVLEPLTLGSLAKYVYAEASKEWIDSDDPLAKEIKSAVDNEDFNTHLVSALFGEIIEKINDPATVDDSVFQSQTYPYQAKFDEWGRGYRGGERGNAMQGNPAGSPNVLVRPLMSRDEAVNVLRAIAEQGEATGPDSDPASPSHFDRFLNIYKELKEIISEAGEGWRPSRNIATNPYILFSENNGHSENNKDAITNPEAKLWAHLFNLRYRLLLNFLAHSFQLDDGFNNSGTKTPRATIINATFGEMYNLRSIAFVLVQTPLTQKEGEDKMAGPPFLIPYTLDLPMSEHNRWRQHKDVLTASGKIIAELLPVAKTVNQKYLRGLRETDQELLQIIDQLTTAPIL